MIYNPFYIETGIEAGVYLSDLAFITLSAGQSNFPFFTDPTYTARFEITPQFGSINLLAGDSFGAYRDSLEVKMMAGFFGISVNDFTLLAEYDVMNNFLAREMKSSTFIAEASYKLTKGLEALVRYDRFVPFTDKTDLNFSHLVLGFEIHPYSFIELRPQYRINMEKPAIVKNDAFVLQFHFWY